MRNFKKNASKVVWFLGGFSLGLTLISITHATIVNEMNGGKVAAPNLEQDFQGLNALESKYAESIDQQRRIQTAVTRANRPPVKTARAVAPSKLQTQVKKKISE